MNSRIVVTLVAICLITGLGSVAHAATITIVNNDNPGEGFNDPTPVAPVGGNTGTTLGEQRLIVFETAARIASSSVVRRSISSGRRSRRARRATCITVSLSIPIVRSILSDPR